MYTEPINSLAASLYSAIIKDLKDVEYEYHPYDKPELIEQRKRRPWVNECEVDLWQQSWSNTSCGHGSMAGQSMCRSDIVLIIGPWGDVCVYSIGRLLYYLEYMNETFKEDRRNRNIKEKSQRGRYLKKDDIKTGNI